jgi:hypothetical protein
MTAAAPDARESFAPMSDPGPPVAVPPHLLLAARIACAALAAVGLVAVVTMIVGAWRRGATAAAPPGAAVGLAVFVVGAIAFAFLAAHGRARVRPRAFAGVALGVCAAQAAALAWLLIATGPSAAAPSAQRILPAPFLGTVLALTLTAAALLGLIAARSATEDFLLQSAHRAFAVGFWLLVARAVFLVWDRPLAVREKLLPAAFVLFAWSALAPLALVHLRPERRRVYDEASPLALAAAVMLVPTIAWLVLARL